MLENTHKSTSSWSEVVNAFCFIDHHQGYIRALNVNSKPLSYTLLVQDKFVKS